MTIHFLRKILEIFGNFSKFFFRTEFSVRSTENSVHRTEFSVHSTEIFFLREIFNFFFCAHIIQGQFIQL